MLKNNQKFKLCFCNSIDCSGIIGVTKEQYKINKEEIDKNM